MNETWLTQEAFDRLQAELAQRSGELREEIKNRIAAAREEGDLKENGGYHAAREEQGKNEARIRIQQLLPAGRVGSDPCLDTLHGCLIERQLAFIHQIAADRTIRMPILVCRTSTCHA